jgi:glucose-1-phosphate thymidylyltransferase
VRVTSLTPTPWNWRRASGRFVRRVLEINGINRLYLGCGNRSVEIFGCGFDWRPRRYDSLPQTLMCAETIEQRPGMKICCPEETALGISFIEAKQQTSARTSG